MPETSITQTKPEIACFVICPIGEPGTPERIRSDEVFDLIIAPVAQRHGLDAFRSDHMQTGGRQITSEVISQLLTARIVVADLTGSNANVFYELGIRHSAQLPVVLLAERDAPIPFNVHGLRVIQYTLGGSDTRKARESLDAQISLSSGRHSEDFFSSLNTRTSRTNSASRRSCPTSTFASC